MLINHSCAKRAADPTNELAACLTHCGDESRCMLARPAQHARAEGLVDDLMNAVRYECESRNEQLVDMTVASERVVRAKLALLAELDRLRAAAG